MQRLKRTYTVFFEIKWLSYKKKVIKRKAYIFSKFIKEKSVHKTSNHSLILALYRLGRGQRSSHMTYVSAYLSHHIVVCIILNLYVV